MAYEKRNNSGTLNRNDRKLKPNHPDHRGQCIIDGVEYWIGAWIKEGANGKFFSLSFQRKEDSTYVREADANVIDEDVPF
jgi:hypothetical protein